MTIEPHLTFTFVANDISSEEFILTLLDIEEKKQLVTLFELQKHHIGLRPSRISQFISMQAIGIKTSIFPQFLQETLGKK